MRATIQAMGSARKPVIVRKFSREWYAGYAGAVFGQDSPALEILDLSGKVLTIGWEAVKWVCYVRDFSSSRDHGQPGTPPAEKVYRTASGCRAMAAHDLDRRRRTGRARVQRPVAGDGAGLLVTPPDTRSNTQRIYVPRQAIQTLEVVSLIGASGRKRRLEADQPELFPSAPDSE